MINVLEMLEASEARYGESVAFADEKNAISYCEVVQYSKKIGSMLAKDGYRNSAVAVLVPKNAMIITCFMGIVYSGNFYVPIDAEMPVDRMKIIFDTILPKKIIVTKETCELDLQEYNQNVYGIRKGHCRHRRFPCTRYHNCISYSHQKA